MGRRTSPVPPDPSAESCALLLDREGPELQLSWSTNFSGFALQYKTNLDPRLPWLTVSNQGNPFSIGPSDPTRFYRIFNYR